MNTSIGGLAKLWHTCPNHHAERFPWHAAFTAVPLCVCVCVCGFTSVSILRRVCVCVCISDCLEILMNYRCCQIILRIFYTNRDRDFYHWGVGLAVTGRIRETGQKVLISSYQTAVVAAPVTSKFYSLSHSSRGKLLET